MAVLRGSRAALGALLALCAGCALLQRIGGEGEPRFAFSHEVHVAGEEMDCVSCHENFARSDDPGMPAPDTCAACHDEIDEDQPPERQVASLFEGEVFRAAHAARLDEELVFSHRLHAADPDSCGECHRGIEHNRAIGEAIGVTMARCVECHAQRGVAGECSTCHTLIDEDWAPPSHAQLWQQRHGRAARACPSATADDCGLCHTERTCIACHLEERPASHDPFFVRRGHGLLARMDRASCATCHEPDSCDQCHRDTRPLSHTGSWGGTLSRHCLSCHVPLQAGGCAVCHHGTPSHLAAPPKPAWHTPAMNCRQCHGLSQPLPHVDNGDDCNACHP
jgi:hypothetical protein